MLVICSLFFLSNPALAIQWGLPDCDPVDSSGLYVQTNCKHPSVAWSGGFRETDCNGNNTGVHCVVPTSRHSHILVHEDANKYVFAIASFSYAGTFLRPELEYFGITLDGKILGATAPFDNSQYIIGSKNGSVGPNLTEVYFIDMETSGIKTNASKDVPEIAVIVVGKNPDLIKEKWGANLPKARLPSINFVDELIASVGKQNLLLQVAGYGIEGLVNTAGTGGPRPTFAVGEKRYGDGIKLINTSRNTIITKNNPGADSSGVCTGDGPLLYQNGNDLVVLGNELGLSGQCTGFALFPRYDTPEAVAFFNCVTDPNKTPSETGACGIQVFPNLVD